jgi:thiamine biosynthesis lipoprotein ApbE
MNKLRHRIHQITLLAAAAVVFAGCGGKDAVAPADVEKQAFEDLRSEIRDVVADSSREAEAIRLVDVLQKDMERLRNSIAARSSRLRELNADYDTTRADFDDFLASIESEVRENRQHVTEAHQALLAATTSEERSRIDKFRTKAINAAINSIQSI